MLRPANAIRPLRLTVRNAGPGLLQGKIAVGDETPWLTVVGGENDRECPLKTSHDQAVTLANAASFDATQVARGSIAAGFGTNLANATTSASSANLPYDLAGVSVGLLFDVSAPDVRRAADGKRRLSAPAWRPPDATE